MVTNPFCKAGILPTECDTVKRKDAALAQLREENAGWYAECVKLRSRLEAAEKDAQAHKDVGESLMKEVKRLDKELEAAEGKVEQMRAWVVKSMFCSAPYCKGCADELEKILGEP